ncbi:MAG TPA: CDC27 family protein [Mycobacterium sp.]|nr:CDC27 family protein [Mycobacterium sp.]
MAEPGSDATAVLSEAEQLVQAGDFSAAVEMLENLVDREPTLAVLYLLATTNLELGEHDKALHYALAAVESDPNSAPARDVLAKVHVALRNYASALTELEAVAALNRDERLAAQPAQYSVPAHFALHNVEQLDHILAGNGGRQASAGGFSAGLQHMRRGLTDVIDGADGQAPWIPVTAINAHMLADPPYVKVPEERLPEYLNPTVDYGSIQQAVAAGENVHVIDDFLTPEALAQVRKFCLESTVWRHPYQFGYVGAFPQHGFASVSLFAIAEEFSKAMGEAFADYQLAQWWAFVYDAKLPGTDIHGDDADFSLNMWITPDSANLDPSSGGLVIWDKKAPSDWSYGDYNSGGDKVRQYLEEQDAVPNVIPYRENRAVLFEGHLFHKTDDFTFAPGFENRRRSVTILFRGRKR